MGATGVVHRLSRARRTTYLLFFKSLKRVRKADTFIPNTSGFGLLRGQIRGLPACWLGPTSGGAQGGLQRPDQLLASAGESFLGSERDA
jgi:hypothetical protein